MWTSLSPRFWQLGKPGAIPLAQSSFTIEARTLGHNVSLEAYVDTRLPDFGLS